MSATATATKNLARSVKIPICKRWKESSAARLRANLRQLMNYSYMLSSTDNLQLIKIKVGELLTLCYGIMAKSDNLLLELKRNVAKPKKRKN